MTAPVELCVVSFSARHDEGRDADYLAWHGLDHLPEQYGIASLVHGQRWVSTPECRGTRNDPIDHVVQYLFSDAAGLDEFFALGASLREAGRMPLRLPPVELAAYAVVERVAHAVRPEVLPWRPCCGAYFVVAHATFDAASLANVDGVAGYWRYRGGQFHPRLADTTGRDLVVAYLDDDPVAVAVRLAPFVADASFAAPFVSVVPFAYDAHLP